jgi:hypothetical protein
VTTATVAGDAGGLVLLAVAIWLAAAGRGGRGTRPPGSRSKIGPRARPRFSARSPSVPARAGPSSHCLAAASPRETREIQATEMTDVPTP